MIKLETKNYILNSVFYFNTLDDCKKFMNVFKNHWCNIDWENPKEIPDNLVKLSSSEINEINKDPKIRAEGNLSWGFSLLKFEGKDKLTKEQSLLISSLRNEIINSNKK